MNEEESREQEIIALMEELSSQARTGGMKTREAALATLDGVFDPNLVGGNFWPESSWQERCDRYRAELTESLGVSDDEADQLVEKASKGVSLC